MNEMTEIRVDGHSTSPLDGLRAAQENGAVAAMVKNLTLTAYWMCMGGWSSLTTTYADGGHGVDRVRCGMRQPPKAARPISELIAALEKPVAT